PPIRASSATLLGGIRAAGRTWLRRRATATGSRPAAGGRRKGAFYFCSQCSRKGRRSALPGVLSARLRSPPAGGGGDSGREAWSSGPFRVCYGTPRLVSDSGGPRSWDSRVLESRHGDGRRGGARREHSAGLVSMRRRVLRCAIEDLAAWH